jgi:rhodanese-related sulfurtransferase
MRFNIPKRFYAKAINSNQIISAINTIKSGNSKIKILDVREYEEVIEGRIDTALHVPCMIIDEQTYLVGEVVNIISMDDQAFKNRYGFEKPSNNDEIICYCKSGKRSDMAADILSNYGFK